MFTFAINLAYADEDLRYVLVDSGVPSSEQEQPYWIDDERVIFRGYETGSYSKEVHASPRSMARAQGFDEHGLRTGYYLWNTKTKQVALYKNKIANLCVEDGVLLYETVATGNEKPIVWQGRLGQEKPIDIEPPRSTFNGWAASCWDTAFLQSQGQKGRYVLRLRPGWGYLDLGSMGQRVNPDASVLLRLQDGTQVKLPVSRSKLWNGGRATFVPHANRHLLVEGQGDGSKIPQAWLLAKDGTLSEIVLPPGPWLSITIHPVAGGVFISSWFTKGKSISDAGGAYLLLDGKSWRLLFNGHKGRAAVSPDGCKVALTVAPSEKAFRESFRDLMAGRVGKKTMRMIDICEGRKT